VCLSDSFSDANPDATSDRPSDGPDFCPTFSRRGYCKNNDQVSGESVGRAAPRFEKCCGKFYDRGAAWGTEPVVVRCWCAGIAAYLFDKNSAMAKCISGLSIKVL
jgi:hypothetical protein